MSSRGEDEDEAMRASREHEEFVRDLVDPPGMRAIREQQERLRDLIDPPGMRAMREQQERLRDLVDPPGMRSVREHQELLRDLIDPPALRSIHEQQKLLRTLVGSQVEASEDAFRRSVEVLGRGAGLVEAALRLGHSDDYALSAGMAALGISKLATTAPQPFFLGVQEFVQTGLDFLEQPLDEAPTSLLAHVPAELFRALDLDSALQSTSESPVVAERAGLAAQTSDELEALLESREPELVSILRGARQAVHSQNADKARHVCISLREMLGHALRRLAPDQAVGAWTAAPAHYHQGRPTRRARLEFLYSSIDDVQLRRLVAADIHAATELFDVLSQGAHVASMGASDAALMLLATRAEGVLLFLMRVTAPRGGNA